MAFADLVAGVDLAVRDALGGETITYVTDAGDTIDVVGIFDAQYVLAKGAADAGVETLGPAVFLRLADLPDPEDDEPTLLIGGIYYRVIERRPDGVGGIVLALRRMT